jgi:hypothetical protein
MQDKSQGIYKSYSKMEHTELWNLIGTDSNCWLTKFKAGHY